MTTCEITAVMTRSLVVISKLLRCETPTITSNYRFKSYMDHICVYMCVYVHVHAYPYMCVCAQLAVYHMCKHIPLYVDVYKYFVINICMYVYKCEIHNIIYIFVCI